MQESTAAEIAERMRTARIAEPRLPLAFAIALSDILEAEEDTEGDMTVTADELKN